MKKSSVVLAALCLAALSMGSVSALAQMGAKDPVSLGTFGAWTAYTFDDGGGKVCFMSSQPIKQEASVQGAKRGAAFMFVTHWAVEKTKNVISISVGYTLRENGSVTLAVDGSNFTLFTQGEMAWTRDQTTDDAISAALAQGSNVTVKGTSWRGTHTTDTYSLQGSADAYRAISQECGV